MCEYRQEVSEMQTKIKVLLVLSIGFLCFTHVINAKDDGFTRTLLLAEKSKALYDIVTCRPVEQC